MRHVFYADIQLRNESPEAAESKTPAIPMTFAVETSLAIRCLAIASRGLETMIRIASGD